MEYIYTSDYQAMSQMAARWVAREVLRNPALVLGLPTGETPIGMYRYLIRLVEEGLISFAETCTFNLDEYVGLGPDHPQSYAMYMKAHFWIKAGLKPENINIPNGIAPDLAEECRRYDAKIEQAGGIDLQILGLGLNGHIGFNEPSHNLAIRTHVVDLTPETIKANARFFSSMDLVPRQAITMGIGTIMQARKILLLVSGDNKKEILRKAVYGEVSTIVPASILQLHRDVTIITDIKI
ncbi:glucosamine-6-phosphate deaminase [Sporolituus thermophilus]|uniref:Glucosamine-6-phosphate deaminase n=1 Tax=Sporolituus thermophilus DSM 23256 TaxID=1123285 RepID=A0A1G7IMA8_9FIRM|nr:glucosamine-6-phosphate deaminase [Sporolituus thermophilus]SDF13872.1 glucosamine-6-phosphate deaminase [Sporolituus thermophilus DSM 23256]